MMYIALHNWDRGYETNSTSVLGLFSTFELAVNSGADSIVIIGLDDTEHREVWADEFDAVKKECLL